MNDGLSGTVAKVNETSFTPGSQILFARGGEWRESLVASSSGTTAAPIVYDAYGVGPKPHFWGSDVLDKSQFLLVSGSTSTYSIASSEVVTSVLLDHQFTRSAKLVTGSGNAQTNINYVKANANTWYYDEETLYLNTGTNPATDSRLYTASVRDNVVLTFGKDNLVFRNLIADESARYNAGYAFRIESSNNVLVENSEAYRAGKHHFGVINSSGFIGRELHAALSMPDQGYGGASPYVSYSGDGRSDTSIWTNVFAENPDAMYSGFVAHGAGLHELTIQNMNVKGGGLFIVNESPDGNYTVTGGHVDNAPVDIFGNNVTIDGIVITGPNGSASLSGNNNVIQNSFLIGREPNWWGGRKAAIVDAGTGNIIRFNTIMLGPVLGSGGGSIAIANPNSNSEIYANVFSDPHSIVFFSPPSAIQAHDNFFASDAQFWIVRSTGAVEVLTLAEWKELGYDLDSVIGLPISGDADLDGDIDNDDYARIDHGYANHVAGFQNGDFDLSGRIDADDYFLIHRAFMLAYWQGMPQESSSVPEPSSLVFCLSAALFFRRR
ncbi:hypothetical protein KW783_01830 [Candidatus Parcubacteria bacterium]|nr:hypothetical protein [Candidatus Parcubacteria bacterium]